MIHVLCQILSIKCKLNFLQLERYGTYSEQTYRNQYEQKFDFFALDNLLIEGVVVAERIIAFDPSYIPKAGKSNYGNGKYWSGVAGASKWGLEIGGFAVVDVTNNSAFHLQAYQTLELFIRKFAINPNTTKNQKIVLELLEYGKIAA